MTFGDSLSPRFFRYCMISAAWQLTSDTRVYFELPLASSAACGKVELIGTTSTAHPRGETWGTFYKFKDGDQIGFAKALWKYRGGVPYTRKNEAGVQDGGGVFSRMKWFGHGGAKGHPSTKAQVIFGYEPKCFVSRPSLGQEYSLDEFINQVNPGQAGAFLQKGDKLRLEYYCEAFVSQPVVKNGSNGTAGWFYSHDASGGVQLTSAEAADAVKAQLMTNSSPENVQSLKSRAYLLDGRGKLFSLTLRKTP